jgi:hypothetical protein
MSKRIPVGWLAKLKLSEVAEGHYYRNGDLIQIRQSAGDGSGSVYSAYVLRTKRLLHFLLRDKDVTKLQPLEQLALVPDLQFEVPETSD